MIDFLLIICCHMCLNNVLCYHKLISIHFLGGIMKLITVNQVCEILGISKSTLYRWANVSGKDIGERVSVMDELSKQNSNELDIPINFPKPYKLGRQFKWKEEDIINWLETTRVK